ncbi:hypothetical protein BGZ96_011484 [Linnemannia gamsii]|uniref:Uncharacterized protein n=1 Tax=Linnemannia gamsii TaxID=64522 RepID=A0ABQ7JST5_9FUNG|nr:hypothetical protein BGZ96_011484 [Linnemannia gamsii]
MAAGTTSCWTLGRTTDTERAEGSVRAIGPERAGVAGGKRRKTKKQIGEDTDTKDDNDSDEQVEDDDKFSRVDSTKALVQLIQDNKELVSWTFEKFRTSHFSFEVWEAIVKAAHDRLESKRLLYGGRRMSATTAARTGLELLEVKQMTIDKESGPWFVKACRLAKVLKLVVVNLTHANLLHTSNPRTGSPNGTGD